MDSFGGVCAVSSNWHIEIFASMCMQGERYKVDLDGSIKIYPFLAVHSLGDVIWVGLAYYSGHQRQ